MLRLVQPNGKSYLSEPSEYHNIHLQRRERILVSRNYKYLKNMNMFFSYTFKVSTEKNTSLKTMTWLPTLILLALLLYPTQKISSRCHSRSLELLLYYRRVSFTTHMLRSDNNEDVIFYILSYLSPEDLLFKIGILNYAWSCLIETEDLLWRLLCKEHKIQHEIDCYKCSFQIGRSIGKQLLIC
jgi:hypothetical protein